MVYVDLPVFKKPGGKKTYSHLVADSLDELHAFAASIGVKPHFFHRSKKTPHYDITVEQHDLALKNGAVHMSSREVVAKSKAMLKAEHERTE